MKSITSYSKPHLDIEFNTKDGIDYFCIESSGMQLQSAIALDDFDGLSEKTSDFSSRYRLPFCVNASTFDMERNELRGIKVVGNQLFENELNTFGRVYLIKDGKTQKLTWTNRPTVGNCLWSVLGFFPIIENGKSVFNLFSKDYPHKNTGNPQQIVYQYEDGTIGFFTSEGRYRNGKAGFKVEECISILLDKKIDFAYLLDGGGSTTTCVNGKIINKLPYLQEERAVKDYLFLI